MTKIAKIPTSFIKAYVKANGEIDEVNVEYEMKADGVIGINTNGGGKAMGITNQRWELKLRDDNTVICTQAKTMYSRDEVIKLLKPLYLKAYHEGHERNCATAIAESAFSQWIEENL